MLDPILKQKLKSYTKKIETRKEALEKFKDSYNKRYKLDKMDDIEEKLHIIAIGILQSKNYNFKKDRVAHRSALRISDNNELEEREYRCKRWGTIKFTSFYSTSNKYLIDDERFKEVIEFIYDMIEEEKEEDEPQKTMDNNFRRGFRQYHERKDKSKPIKLKLDKPYTAEFIDSWTFKINKLKIVSLILYPFQSEIKVEIELNKDVISEESLEEILADDFIFKKAKELCNKGIEEQKKRKQKYLCKKQKIMDFIGKKGLMDYLVLHSL